ncbi:aminotransferase class I/II-fold pyridoxal phosphate-dependent enzyme [Parafrigoribacterium mesophilum]|uniref:MalY/PatB family protein n=1 Tax=Parafrigoribacterium mesophilum TaxID=433646 RepID=UPI0031FCEA08
MEIKADPLSLLRTRTSEKWTAYPPDVLPLFVAEMDFPLAEPIAAALTAAIRRSDTGYEPSSTQLPEAFAGFARRHWDWVVDPARVSSTTDVSVTIVESLRLAISPGDGVVLNPPVYAPFFDLIAEAGGMPVEVPLLRTGEAWELDLEAIEHAFIAGARGYLLCNPHNPLGLVHSAEQLGKLAELAAKYDATVVSDEIHAPLTYSTSRFTPFLSVSEAAREQGIAVTSASKSWNIAGLKCALFVTASDRMSQLLSQLPEEVHFRTSLFGRIASVTGFTVGDPWLDAAKRALDANRALLGALLAEHLPEVRYRAPEASYLAWLDFRALDWGDDPSLHALEQARVALNPGPSFGAQGRGFVRLNFGCSPDVLTEAIGRLAAAR